MISGGPLCPSGTNFPTSTVFGAKEARNRDLVGAAVRPVNRLLAPPAFRDNLTATGARTDRRWCGEEKDGERSQR